MLFLKIIKSQMDISNRAIVVHAGEDDLGRGGDEESGRY